MAHRFEMFPLPANVISALPKTAVFQGAEIPTSEVETRVSAQDRCDVSVQHENGRTEYPWRSMAVREYDEHGVLVGSST